MPTAKKTLTAILMFALISLLSLESYAQAKKAKTTKPAKAPKSRVVDPNYLPGPLFNTDSIFDLKLTGNLKAIYNDRDDKEVGEHPMLMQFQQTPTSKVTALPLVVKARGHFRRMKTNCDLPPLWLEFNKEAKLKGSLFEKQKKLKLVTPCRGDNYVVREFLIYKIYNLISPQCMRARLVKVTYEDSMGKVKTQTQYSILIEDDMKAAKRNFTYINDVMMVRMENVNAAEFTKLAVFEYLIGNTDWSVPYLHNIKLAYKDSTSTPIAIPYDFDHSGMVDAPYAVPPEQLELTSVRQRRYRGYCQPMDTFKPTFDLFNKLKDDIYKIYTDCPYIDEKYKKSTIKYLDDFYKVINTPKIAEKEFGFPCVNRDRINVGGYENQN